MCSLLMRRENYKAGKIYSAIIYNFILTREESIIFLHTVFVHTLFFSIARLELRLRQVENELLKAKEQITIETNNNSKNELTIKRLKKQLYMVTWV